MSEIDLTSKVGTLKLPEPFWIASAHRTQSKSAIRSWRAIKPSALTLKTSMREAPKEEKPTVREQTFPRLPHLGLSLYCDGPKNKEFLPYTKTAELLKYAVRMLPNTKVGISVVAGKEENYRELRGLCSDASFCELNLKYSFRVSYSKEGSCFFGTPENIGAAREFYERMFGELRRFLADFDGVPVFIKISRELAWLPGTSEFSDLLDVLASHNGGAGLILTNSLKKDVPPFMADGREWRWAGGVLCGEHLFEDTIQLIRRCYADTKKRNIPIVASGGMVGPTQILAALQAGAAAVQLCTIFDYRGLDYYHALCWNLEGRIENLGLRSLSQYVDRLRQESASTIYNMPFIYFERFLSKEAQRRLLRDVLRSQRMDMLVMSGRTLVDEWRPTLKKRFEKNLGFRVLLPNPEGLVFAAIQKSWGIREGSELDSRKQRVGETRDILLKLWNETEGDRRGMIQRESTEADKKRSEADAAVGNDDGEGEQGQGEEEILKLKEASGAVFLSDQCIFYSFYIFDDRVYIAPYPFTRAGKVDVPIYVFLAGTYEFERIDNEFEHLLKFATQTEQYLQLAHMTAMPAPAAGADGEKTSAEVISKEEIT
jgi:dihydroorotate dehydrogenase